MARFRNDTGSVLNATELGQLIGPGEELDSDLHVPGCTDITPPPVKTRKDKAAATPASEEPQP